MRGAAPWLAPVIFLCIMAAPVVVYMLPAFESHISEIYQPLRALKFYASLGQDYHKWGPLPNFLLAPGYAITLGYWYLAGSFTNPSDDFPYGLAQPLEQLTFLILQGRVLFFALAIVSLIAIARAMKRMTADWAAIALAMLFCLATNYTAIRLWPSMKPDGPMLTFAALALAVYVRIVCDGFSIRRGVWMSIFAACAMSSKELAAMLFILPYVALLWVGWRESESSTGRRVFLRGFGISIAAGVITYALLNVVYAPAVWWERIQFWTAGAGKSPEVWASPNGPPYIVNVLFAILNTFGPGGIIVLMIAVIAALARPSKRAILLTLPAVSVLGLGILPMGYANDRFYLGFALALALPTALGLAKIDTALAGRPAMRWAWRAFIGVALLCNINFATFTWHQLDTLEQASIDRYVQAHLPRNERVHIFSLWEVPQGKERLAIFGYRQDGRTIMEIVAAPTQERPEWILSDSGSLMFLDEAAATPSRASMLQHESGFDVSQWRGVEGLGYERIADIEPETPWWFLFDWMPAVREHRVLSRLVVFRRVEE